jgi:hypothetical protein
MTRLSRLAMNIGMLAATMASQTGMRRFERSESTDVGREVSVVVVTSGSLLARM